MDRVDQMMAKTDGPGWVPTGTSWHRFGWAADDHGGAKWLGEVFWDGVQWISRWMVWKGGERRFERDVLTKHASEAEAKAYIEERYG